MTQILLQKEKKNKEFQTVEDVLRAQINIDVFTDNGTTVRFPVPSIKSNKMSKSRRKTRRSKEYAEKTATFGVNDKKPLFLRNSKQKLYMEYMERRDIVFATGFPGTAKTLLALYKGFEMLDNKRIKQVLYCKPKVGIPGEKDMGALPGTLEEKTAPHLAPVIGNLSKFMSPGRVQYIMAARGKDDSVFEFLPFDFLRGQTFDDSFIIVDEAQNMTAHTAYSILSRIGNNSKMIITGDTMQRDLKLNHGKSGLEDALFRLSQFDFIGHIHFEYNDIERSEIAKKVIGAYRDLYGQGK